MDDLAAYRHIHLVGAGGAGMRGLAVLLAGLGHRVTGSDLEPSPYLDRLAALGIETWVGHRPGRAGEWDLVAASSAVPSHDEELAAAAAAGVPVWARPRLLGALTATMPAIGVTGTHGKTTATAMAVAALQAAGADPSYLVGGELIKSGTGAHIAMGGPFVLEADEAFGTFLELQLAGLLVTNVEADHLDHYGTVAEMEKAYLTVARGVDGPLVVGVDDPGGRRLAEQTGAVTYGTAPDADWQIDDVTFGPWEVSFVMRRNGQDQAVTVPKPGIHVARNAAGVLALAAELGFDLGAAAAGLAAFAGVRRRHEVRARVAGVTIIDDYAHHPTELAATLAAARGGSPARLWAVFQPHRFSRTAEHGAALGAALAGADRVVVTDVYPAGEPPIAGVSGRLVADGAAAAGAADVAYVSSRDDLADHLAAAARSGDVVLLLGAGDITGVAAELADRLGEGTP